MFCPPLKVAGCSGYLYTIGLIGSPFQQRESRMYSETSPTSMPVLLWHFAHWLRSIERDDAASGQIA